MLNWFSSCQFMNPSMSSTDTPDSAKNHEPSHASTISNGRSFLVTLSAQALGSLGMGLSILAIWVRWVAPSYTSTPELVPPGSPYKRRRRSLTPSKSVPRIIPSRRAYTPPMLKTTVTTHQAVSTIRHKRVYFLDSPLPTIKSQQVLTSTAEVHSEIEIRTEIQHPAPQFGAEDGPPSPLSSTILVTNTTSHVHTQSFAEPREESIADSDSSSRRSSISSNFAKKMNPFLAKARRGQNPTQSAPTSPASSMSVLPPDEPKIERKLAIVRACKSRRGSCTTTVEALPESTPVKNFSRSPFRRFSGSKPSAPLAPTEPATASSSYFSRRNRRRASTPVSVPRTSPYEAPYFAAPPIPLDPTYPAYLRGLPQFEDVLSSKASRSQALDRGREPRQPKSGMQATLGIGRPKSLHRRRSASEGATTIHRTPL